MGQLDGKTALVTGGTSGIGLATAKRFAAEGAHVFITGRDQQRLDNAVKEVGDATGVQGDVGVLDDLDRLAALIADHGKGLDAVFVNAGIGEFATLDSIGWEDYQKTFNNNVGGVIFTVQKVLPQLNPGASIVLTGSSSAGNGQPAFGLYAASKAAIRSLGRTWAGELVGRGVRVNTIVPGPTETPGLGGLVPDNPQGLFDQLAHSIPMGRIGRPEEIANTVLFLVSHQSTYMTGAEVWVDGGAEQI
ncbi:oxidoreductase [Paractinoplanes abujensis]|uniref:NAD(P)-dependent dehydrogenase (Short-subunit alcohol dehydrogenase family) n=1 Tax=Paractinoplanes abujensis TaxID=882441 RepID=A0A7W7G238_9ACTN|nr:SDR family oxidoreductase [Actinoplanes abujensis]MBB4693309.1 NAD(P)-dependent dehydrogenase (short-subunit alcohol dehydrogenase family) [Actinoplanes abujensis]GID24510.1 oxidoreductase [Actinoplanes abujensis]